MTGRRLNPFLDAPISIERVLLMGISTIVFVTEVIYGTIKGFVWFGIGKEPKNEAKFDRLHELIHFFMKLNIRLHPWLTCEIKKPYKETFKQGAIAICNHQSLIDTLCLLILSPKILIVANRNVIYNPLVRTLLYYAEFVCVDKSIDYLLDYCKRHIKRGYIVVIFPEGKRSKHCDIKRFHSGAFYLSNKLMVDILPLYLHGTGHVLPLGKAFQNNATMSIEIGERIQPQTNELDIRKQTKAMRHHYEIYYDRICKERENASYFKSLVVSLFRTIHRGRKSKGLLLKYNNFSQWINCDYQDGTTVYIEDKTYGVFTLMFALVHPTIPIVLIGNNDLVRIYRNHKYLPQNIKTTQNDNETKQITKNRFCKIDNIVTIYTINRIDKYNETANT